jgi:hypothetical protein
MKKFENLKNINIKIVNPDISSPYQVFNHTKKEFKEKEYDAAFCVIDGDVLKDDGSFGEKFRGKGVETILSRPCFELWFLLHYKYTNREFHNCGELISKELKRHIPDYEKSKVYHLKRSFYETLKSTLGKAIGNAKRLELENEKNNKPYGTSTGIYKLIERILTA